MFIDFLTLMLTNMSAGFLIYALYMAFLFESEPKKAIPGFLLTGLIALIAGFRMIFTWPLPGSYNIPYGELSVFFGGLFLATGIALAVGWDLIMLGVYAFVVGFPTVIIGIRVYSLGLTTEPLLAALGFILTGVASMLVLPTLFFKRVKVLRYIVAGVILVAAGLWAFTGFAAYWTHLASFAKWVPATMK